MNEAGGAGRAEQVTLPRFLVILEDGVVEAVEPDQTGPGTIHTALSQPHQHIMLAVPRPAKHKRKAGHVKRLLPHVLQR